MVNINPLYTAPELEYALNKVNVKVLICPETIGALDYYSILQDLIPNLEKRDRNNLKVPSLKTLEKIIFYSNPEPKAGTFQWSDIEQAAESEDFNKIESIKIRSILLHF